MVANSKQKPTARVCEECLEKLDKMGLLGRKSSFDKALHIILGFCDKNKGEFKKWKEKNLKILKSKG